VKKTKGRKKKHAGGNKWGGRRLPGPWTVNTHWGEKGGNQENWEPPLTRDKEKDNREKREMGRGGAITQKGKDEGEENGGGK